MEIPSQRTSRLSDKQAVETMETVQTVGLVPRTVSMIELAGNILDVLDACASLQGNVHDVVHGSGARHEYSEELAQQDDVPPSEVYMNVLNGRLVKIHKHAMEMKLRLSDIL